MEYTVTGLPALVLISALVVLPLKISASWFNAARSSFLVCLLAAIAGPLSAYIAFSLAGGGFLGLILAFVAMGASLGAILGTSVGDAIKLGFVALILSAAAFKLYGAIVSAVAM